MSESNSHQPFEGTKSEASATQEAGNSTSVPQAEAAEKASDPGFKARDEKQFEQLPVESASEHSPEINKLPARPEAEEATEPKKKGDSSTSSSGSSSSSCKNTASKGPCNKQIPSGNPRSSISISRTNKPLNSQIQYQQMSSPSKSKDKAPRKAKKLKRKEIREGGELSAPELSSLTLEEQVLGYRPVIAFTKANKAYLLPHPPELECSRCSSTEAAIEAIKAELQSTFGGMEGEHPRGSDLTQFVDLLEMILETAKPKAETNHSAKRDLASLREVNSSIESSLVNLQGICDEIGGLKWPGRTALTSTKGTQAPERKSSSTEVSSAASTIGQVHENAGANSQPEGERADERANPIETMLCTARRRNTLQNVSDLKVKEGELEDAQDSELTMVKGNSNPPEARPSIFILTSIPLQTNSTQPPTFTRQITQVLGFQHPQPGEESLQSSLSTAHFKVESGAELTEDEHIPQIQKTKNSEAVETKSVYSENEASSPALSLKINGSFSTKNTASRVQGPPPFGRACHLEAGAASLISSVKKLKLQDQGDNPGRVDTSIALDVQPRTQAEPAIQSSKVKASQDQIGPRSSISNTTPSIDEFDAGSPSKAELQGSNGTDPVSSIVHKTEEQRESLSSSAEVSPPSDSLSTDPDLASTPEGELQSLLASNSILEPLDPVPNCVGLFQDRSTKAYFKITPFVKYVNGQPFCISTLSPVRMLSESLGADSSSKPSQPNQPSEESKESADTKKKSNLIREPSELVLNQSLEYKSLSGGKDMRGGSDSTSNKYLPIEFIEVSIRKSSKTRIKKRVFSTIQSTTDYPHANLFDKGRTARFFEELDVLGKGGFGTVYKMRSLLDDREYAVKKIQIHIGLDEDFKNHHVYREIIALSQFSHKNVVRYYSCWIEPENPNRRLVEEAGKKLEEVLQKEPRSKNQAPMPGTKFSSIEKSSFGSQFLQPTTKPMTQLKVHGSRSGGSERSFLEESQIKEAKEESKRDSAHGKSQLRDNGREEQSASSSSSLPKSTPMQDDLSLNFSFRNLQVTTIDDAETSEAYEQEQTTEEDQTEDESFSDVRSDSSIVQLMRKQKSIITLNVMIQMEYCTGDTLRSYLGSSDYKVDRAQIFNLFKQILKGLKHIHEEGLIHRDVKPENIFIDKTRQRLKIGDFGLAKQQEDFRFECQQRARLSTPRVAHGPMGSPEQDQEDLPKRQSQAANLLQSHQTCKQKPEACTASTTDHEASCCAGTPMYQAPEQAYSIHNRSRKDKSPVRVTHKADMFAAGLILYEMCAAFRTGHQRFEEFKVLKSSRHPKEEVSSLLPLESELIINLTDPDPQKRSSASALLKSASFLLWQEEVQPKRQRRSHKSFF